MKFNKLLNGYIFIWIYIANINAVEIKIDSYGHVGAMYNQGFQGSKTSVISLSAIGGANFYFDNGLSLGLGAVGAWAAYNNEGSTLGVDSGKTNIYTSTQYPGTGDVATAFIGYKGYNMSLYVGRYSASFLDFDWLSGANTQGIGFKYDNLAKTSLLNKLDFWVTYFNSVLITGYQPGRIGSELGTMYAYHPGGRNDFVGRSGANVIATGVNMDVAGFILDPYILVNTSVVGTNDILLQAGAKFGYVMNFAKQWKSSTLVRAIFQFAPRYSINSDVGFLGWLDQEFKYSDWIKFGIGGYFDGGQDIWTINDNSRFYGRWVNAYKRNYFGENIFSGYVFSEFSFLNDRLGLDLIFAGGSYTEFSAIIRGTTWQKNSMKAEVGGGYVYSSLRGNAKNPGTGGNLLLFTKLSY